MTGLIVMWTVAVVICKAQHVITQVITEHDLINTEGYAEIS